MQMTSFSTSFQFHGSLNDFLPRRQKNKAVEYNCKFSTSVKDAMEAIGVPHVEVRKIWVNGSEQSFNYLLQPGNQIEVFPYDGHFPAVAPRIFVLDVHLGGLARLLRMLGIDAVYQNEMHDREIVTLAVTENRAVLTRDIGLLKHKVLQHGYWLRSQQSREQLLEVIRRFSLCACLLPFSRCIACNGLLAFVAKEEVLPLLPAQTKEYFTEFYQCSNCGRVYWKGSHYKNMQQVVDRLRSLACQ
ncbi:MAG TPA: Mut7-C RNAse domain-containing protein [Flavisolibacter sp.]|nr:Mut7-C RNAse domain-containing protein [Flavisolibacter sp.]